MSKVLNAAQYVLRRASEAWWVSGSLRRLMLNLGGCDIKRALILDGVQVHGRHLIVEPGSFINRGTCIEARARVELGTNVSIAMGCRLITSTHVIGGAERRGGTTLYQPINIGNGVWVGAGATILPGVTVGAGAVIGAGAIVAKDVPANALVVGVPARVIRFLDIG